MNIVFAGTPQFAADHLKILLDSEHVIKCILTQPDRVSGRGNKIKTSPVKEIALINEIEILQPTSLTDESTIKALKSVKADLMIVVAYGLLIPKKILDIPEMGCVNIHASILPNWRGAAPIEYSIFSGDKETGISYMRMTEGLDEGPILEVHKCKIRKEDDLGSIEDKFIELSKLNLLPFLDKFKKRDLKEVRQENSLATFAPKINPSDQQIDWNKVSDEIDRKIRSLYPKYVAYTFLGDKRIKLHKCFPTESSSGLKPGFIGFSEEKKILVGCKDNTCIRIDKIQIEGKDVVKSEDFVRGYKALIDSERKFSSN